MRLPIIRAVIPPHDVAEGDRPWNSWEAEARLRFWAGVLDAEDQTPEEAWGKFAQGFAWYDVDAARSRYGYRFQHHDVLDGALTLSRVALLEVGAQAVNEIAMATIPESERAGVLEHLGQHYRALGMVPPWEVSEAALGEGEVAVSRVARVFCASEPLHVLYALVAEPDVPDSYDNRIPKEVIARAAHSFMADYARAQARSIEDHRVHPDDWPDGVDAVVSAPEGQYVVDEVRFDRNAGWTEETARAWLDEHEYERGVIDEGPETLELVESAIAPVDMEEMHGIKLASKITAGSWYVAARASPKQWAERDDYSGLSLGGRARSA